MPFRERIRRVFRRSTTSSTSLSSSLNSSSSNTNSSLIYQPGEKMPTPKYRRPVAKEHKEKLEAFNWADAWTNKTFSPMASPMGTRMHSRRNSIRKSFESRRASFHERIDGAVHTSALGQTAEAGDSDGDVANVGLSRRHSRTENHRRDTATRTIASSEPTPSDTRPFDPDDLALAIKRSHLDASH